MMRPESYCDPENKQQFKEFCHEDSSNPIKSKILPSDGKLILTTCLRMRVNLFTKNL